MNKKTTILSLLLITAAIATYVGVAYSGRLPKRQVEIKQSLTNAENLAEQQQTSPTVEQEAPAQPQATTDHETQPSMDQSVDEKVAAIQQPPTEKIAAPAKTPNKTTETKSAEQKIISRLISWGFQKSSGRSIKAVIVHTTYNALGGDPFDFEKVMQEWKDAGVAPHYAIDRDGKIYQLIADQNIAYHAGASQLPDGTTDVNGASIGIEVVNTKDDKFTDAQYDALNYLLGTLKQKYALKYILGHDEIAPGRKTDPWGIDWKKVDR